ncbi:pilus assembly protein PilO [Synechococcales cyanobacterium C]|uniref:Pilus assembly protein PilO n=1 Tax=Petrachloros mirabilis ULC683 TaxID=2781853 RepID=A0A8K1ZXI7_9CYAN|nr:pilus assembly protein PilO [Petrachloros mirabilis]NCJ05831.1 pilus assembly protein PilO [Petrachloros mirabilis ULC683]
MTASGEFANDDSFYDAPEYPTLFGISFTPTVIGVLAAVAGLGLAAYLATQLVAPKYTEYQALQANIAQKEMDLAQREETARRLNEVVANLNEARAENTDVRTLFSTQQALDTLLLDLNRLIVATGGQLLRFTPDYGMSGVVTDSSVGAPLNNRIQRQVTDVSFQGTYGQTLAVMQAIDRLQTVLVVRNLSLEIQTAGADEPANVVRSTFKLYAYVPLSAEEAAEIAAEAAEAEAAPEEAAP